MIENNMRTSKRSLVNDMKINKNAKALLKVKLKEEKERKSENKKIEKKIELLNLYFKKGICPFCGSENITYRTKTVYKSYKICKDCLRAMCWSYWVTDYVVELEDIDRLVEKEIILKVR